MEQPFETKLFRMLATQQEGKNVKMKLKIANRLILCCLCCLLHTGRHSHTFFHNSFQSTGLMMDRLKLKHTRADDTIRAILNNIAFY